MLGGQGLARILRHGRQIGIINCYDEISGGLAVQSANLNLEKIYRNSIETFPVAETTEEFIAEMIEDMFLFFFERLKV